MQRSFRFRRLLVVIGMAVWFGAQPSIAVAQAKKAIPAAEVEGKAQVNGKNLPRVSILRLELIKPDPGPQDNPAAAIRRMRRFNSFNSTPQEGTTLTLLIEEPQARILGLDAKNCKITKFRDDRNTDLTLEKAAVEGRQFPGNLQQGPETCTLTSDIDPAGHFATVAVHSPHLPESGSARLLLEADLVMTYGHGQRTVEQKNVNMKVDTITIGPSPLVLMSHDANDGRGQQDGMRVLIFHDGPIMREFQKFTFIGNDGEELKTMGSGSGSSGSIEHQQFNFAQKFETCTVRLTVPKTVETVTVSIAIDTGVGFPPGARRRTMKAAETGGAVKGAASR